MDGAARKWFTEIRTREPRGPRPPVLEYTPKTDSQEAQRSTMRGRAPDPSLSALLRTALLDRRA